MKNINYAIYARFSCEKQNSTSIEDQVRRCRELARINGTTVSDEFVYVDAAVSGTEAGDKKRFAYMQLRDDWEAGKFDVLLVDEFSRLSRDGVELALLSKKLESHGRMHVVTADGIDTRLGEWQLQLAVKSMIAQSELRNLRHRTERGMVGQLERGYMLADAAFGYELDRQFDEAGKHVGTNWKIDETQAEWVRQIFNRRASGQSMHELAAWLNESGVPPGRRKKRKEDGGHWRASRVKNLLSNQIYKGTFVWHGSTTHAARMKAKDQAVVTVDYPRPHLRIVSDELWDQCNVKRGTRALYGGGTHPMAGLINCGCCGRKLSLTVASKASQSAYCAACTEAKSSTGDTERLTATVALGGVQQLFIHALRYFISGPFIQEFRTALAQRLTGDVGQELQAVEQQLKALKLKEKKLLDLILRQDGEESEMLQQRYQDVMRDIKIYKKQEEKLKLNHTVADENAIRAQLESDPARLLDQLFDADIAPAQLRVTLSRLFPQVVFEGKPNGRYSSYFTLHIAPGALLAADTDTHSLSSTELKGSFVLTYAPAIPQRAGGIRSPASWSVEQIEPFSLVT